MEERKLPLTEEQWSCLRVRMQETGEGMKRVVPCLIEALEGQLSAKRVRRAVAELSDAGYLSEREYLPTKKAERLYRYYLLPWEAICHEQEKLGIEPGERERSRIICSCSIPLRRWKGSRSAAGRSRRGRRGRSTGS